MRADDLVALGGAAGPRVFISYSFDRMRAPAMALTRALRRLGAEVIEPGALGVGEDIREGIASGIQNSNLMIVLVSPGDSASRWMQFETRLMLETCWKRSDTQIAVVAPAVGAIPPALRHRDFVTYYPHDEVRLDSWMGGEAADTFASRALAAADRGRTKPAETISDSEMHEWRNRVVHIGAPAEALDLDLRNRLLAMLRDDFSNLRESTSRLDEAPSLSDVERLLDNSLLANALAEPTLSEGYYARALETYGALGGGRDDLEGDVEYRLALAAQAAGDLVSARDRFEKVVAQRAALFGNNHPATIASRFSLGVVKESLGDLSVPISPTKQPLSPRWPPLGVFIPRLLMLRSD